MDPDWNRIGLHAAESLDGTVRARAAVYVEPRVYAAGETIATGRQTITADEPSVLIFVDLEPHMNWSHDCRYVVYGTASGTLRAFEGRYPPAGERLRLVHRGRDVEDWMLLVR
jgi:hypothetical protein